MKKLFFICCLTATIFGATSCHKEPSNNGYGYTGIQTNYKPVANFSYTTSEITGGLAIKCTNTSSYATGYYWTVEKDNLITDQSTQTNPTFNVYTAGVYTIKLTATNEYGNSTAQKKVTITANPTGYVFKTIKLTKIPMLDSDGSSWDTGLFGSGYPDIFVRIMSEDHLTVYYTGETHDDVSEMPVSWTISDCPTLAVGTKYIVRFSDEDGMDANDVMANCIWDVKTSQVGQTSFNWNATNGTVSFSATIQWVYPSKGEEQLVCVEEGCNEITGEVE